MSSLTKVWLNGYNKWFLSDAKYDHHFEKDGIPLSALEIRDEYLKNKAADIVLVKGPDRTPIDFDEEIGRDKAEFAQTYTWIEWDAYNNMFTVWPDFKTLLIMYEDDYFKNHILPETEEKDVKKAYSSLVQGIDYFLDFVEKNRQIFQILFQEMIYRNPRVKETIDQIIKEFVNLFRHQIDKGIQKGMINITDSEIASWSFVCSILGMALTYLENPSIERAKLARTISELVLLGLFRREVPQKTI